MRKIIPALVAGATALALAGGSFGYAVLDKDVHLSVDGVDERVSTMAGTVGDVLQSRGIELAEHDVVAPSLDTRLSDGTQIAVKYGRQIRVRVDGQQQLYWTTATRVGDALASLDLPSKGAELSTSRNTAIGRGGLSFELATQKTITIDNAGRPQRITTTAQTVAAALAAAKIEVDGDDKLSVSEDTPLEDGTSFTVTKVEIKKVTKKERVKYPIRYTDDERLEKGKTEVKAKGKPGVREVRITEVRHNGRLQSRQQTSTLATPPEPEVVRRGTKDPTNEAEAERTDGDAAAGDDPGADRGSDQQSSDPADDDAANDDAADDNAADDNSAGDNSADDNSAGDNSAGDKSADDKSADKGSDDAGPPHSKDSRDSDDSSDSDDSVWDRVAQCESGQNWSIDTGNGYYGGLQFAPQSWKGYGGTRYAELASEATREEQIVIAEKILADVGWKAWPACSKKLGLR